MLIVILTHSLNKIFIYADINKIIMRIKKKTLFIIICVFASIFALMSSKSAIAKILEIILLTIGIALISKEAIRNVKELGNPSKKQVPKFLENSQKPQGKIALWFMGCFFAFIGLINFKLKFLGASDESGVLPNSFQYTFSFVLIILGLFMLFMALMKSSQKFSKLVIDNYAVISKILFYGFIFLLIFIIISMVSPLIWR
jgi:hypothetical protein